ncbi:MAG TPA: hypothetical protein EYP88_04235 [Anaerolineales bacterium]|nr:hypothetical protein [Anaerolineales bacterium]
MISENLISNLLRTLPEGRIVDICIGLHWTAVVLEVEGEYRCGLASTLAGEHDHTGQADIPRAGYLTASPASELAAFLLEAHPTRRSLGLATINALLPVPQSWTEENAEETILRLGRRKRVALIGHFPFVPRLREQLDHLDVLDQTPKAGDLPPEAAPDVLPRADVIAITSMTLHNGTLENLLQLCRPQSQVMLLGPSTPLSPLLFRYRVDFLAGSLVEDIDAVMSAVAQGGNFRQVHRAGVRLVTLKASRMGAEFAPHGSASA